MTLLLEQRGGFVEHGDAVDRTALAGRMHPRGMRWAAVLGQGNTNRHRLDVAVAFRDRMRELGIAVPLWVVLDADDGAPDPDWDACAALTLELAPHFDGLVLNLERIERRGGLVHYVRAILAGYGGEVLWSSLPTIAGGEVTRSLDARLAVLAQQAYAAENGWDVAACRRYTERPPVYVGWHYRATILGRGRRVLVTGQDGVDRYRVREGRNTWGLRIGPTARVIFNRRTGRHVGNLAGLWATHKRYGPTIRTTPYAGVVVTVDEAFAELEAAGVPGGSVYLLETSTWNRPAGSRDLDVELAHRAYTAAAVPSLRATITAGRPGLL